MKVWFLRLCAASLFACALCAQNWTTAESLPGVDFAGLTGAQRTAALKLVREYACTCGCGMTVAQCRLADPSCAYSTDLAKTVVDSLKAGKSEAGALAAAANSRFGHERKVQILDDPIAIPTAGAPVEGDPGAAVTVIEFSDFQCPYCAQAAPQVQALLKAYPHQVKIVFKQFPLDIHPNAGLAAAASVAAMKQGKFWQMHDALFANRNNLGRENLVAMAAQNNLDVKRFEQDMDSADVHKFIAKDLEDGEKAGVEGTPTIFIDGKKLNAQIEVTVLKPIIDAELRKPVGQPVASVSSAVPTPLAPKPAR